MIYRTMKPQPLLEPYVDCIWLLASSGASPLGDELILPDGKTELIIHFGDYFQKLGPENKFENQARTLFAGQITERIVLRSTGEVGMVAVRFKPGGSSRFFRFPHHELVDQIVDFHDIFGKEIATIQEQILNAATADERMHIIERFLVLQMMHHDSDDQLIRQACRYIEQSGGEYTVGDLVKLIGLSERQFERRFKAAVGLTPKMLARIVRFQRFIALAQEQKIITLTDAAFACGYYDQAHFIRDFKAFAGVNPTNYLIQPHIMSDFFTTPV